ncbi:MAG: DUF368 domain-containing protein [Pseudomonadales bacterium]|nr:DUF368 domain-containing protein [Candidatus Woesebacteria bacterium]MCB9801267.1 DUF368 domain-containing protein [Pseudomonadales bacterium]
MLKYLGIGFVMGAADIVPGVSGGTMAFIFGIYEKLINGIKTVSGKALTLLAKGKLIEALEVIPFHFLVPLALGIGAAVISLSSLLTYMLETYPELIWSFFFGLVVASIMIVSKRIKTWKFIEVVSAIAAAVAAFMIVGAVPTETAATPIAFLASGAVAICAMILPGVSGSFLLIILGKYEQILQAVHDKDIVTLGIFMVGAVIGLALFSRVLSWLFKHHESVIIAVLTGFMLGSLRKIWPWKETVKTIVDSHGEIVPVVQRNVMPAGFNQEFMIAVGLFVLAFVIVTMIEKTSNRKPETL